MLKEERQQYILNRINQNYRIYITALSAELGVSDDTLRRDLTELDERGLLTKVHGGAIAKSGIPIEFTDRLNTRIPAKQQMAAKVIPMFRSGDILLIDGGTSNLEVARKIPLNMELTVYTNSFPIVNALLNHPKLELIFLGGKVFPSSQVTVGVSVFQALQTIRPNWLVLGISDVHPQQGLTAPDREEAMMKRLMIERAQKRIILADGYKLNTAEAYSVASLGDIDYLVTEDCKIDYIKQHWPKGDYIVL
ncbi:DeoR/GlpR family DNA-binding transcription regulator [Parabacteroides timonensis]|uniref:DeoR/GlpR family DNA-binding transcription regulator n=1 Tax=Parabacteroides timonensis TaxID=1871013 RepID=UPI00094E7F92|nr:DeoR/GlpR family DNA-binding transcription regulator [Parabacteroides timonensis]